MYKIHLTKSFKKDAKTLSVADKELTMELIDKLAKSETLEPKHNDHALSGTTCKALESATSSQICY